jgi:murein DD-endopeptidase MepM/ murein hydrolase activator NlpD
MQAAETVGLTTPRRQPRPQLVDTGGGPVGFTNPEAADPFITGFNQSDRYAGQAENAFTSGWGATLRNDAYAAQNALAEQWSLLAGEEGLPTPGQETGIAAPGSENWRRREAAGLDPATGNPLGSSVTGSGAPAGAPQGIIDPATSGLQLGNAAGVAWSSLNQWDAAINAAASQWGVDPNLIKAAIAMESGGVADAKNPDSSSFGVLQIQPEFHRESAAQLGYDLATPEGQIGYFAALISGNAPGQQVRGDTPIDRYINNYQGPEAGQTDPSYTARYRHDVEVLMGMMASSPAAEPQGGRDRGDGAVAAPAPVGSVSAMADIWGGTDEAITQELGSHEGEVYNNNANIYDYCRAMGIDGHCGVDIGLALGTPIAAPVTGTVVSISNQFYTDPYGVGEIRLQAPNGDIIILGHMRTADVRPGDAISVGQPIGTSGQSDSRPESAHLHVEVRVLQPGCPVGDQTPSCYRIADPETYFGAPLGSAPVAPTAGPR